MRLDRSGRRRLRFRFKSFVRHSVWFFPFTSLVLALVFVQVVRWFDAELGWVSPLHADGARALFGALASSMLTFIVFVFSLLLVTVQIAGAQLSPRIIETATRDRPTMIALSAFTFTFTYSLALLARIDTHVPQIGAWVATYGNLGCIAIYICLIDHVGRMLRPAALLDRIAKEGREAIEEVYPRPADDPSAPSPPAAGWPADAASARVVEQNGDAVLVAYARDELVELAREADCVIELVPQVGEFVADGRPLFRIHGGAAIDKQHLRQCALFEKERRMDHDPAFAVRIMVETASKALSPAINDPATAVLAIDRLHETLRLLGGRRLDVGRTCDADGRLRLVVRVPRWEDFVSSATVEIRQFGATSIEVPRRLRAMLEDLIASVPPDRAAPLRTELALLRRATERSFPDTEDRARADVGDMLGMGGSTA